MYRRILGKIGYVRIGVYWVLIGFAYRQGFEGFPRGLFFIELAGSLWSGGLIGRQRASLDFKCLLSNELFDFKEPWVRSSLSEGIKLLKVVSYVTAQRKERKVL